MLAGLGRAGVHFMLTVAARATLWAHAVMGAVLVHALPTCLTQLLQPHPWEEESGMRHRGSYTFLLFLCTSYTPPNIPAGISP